MSLRCEAATLVDQLGQTNCRDSTWIRRTSFRTAILLSDLLLCLVHVGEWWLGPVKLSRKSNYREHWVTDTMDLVPSLRNASLSSKGRRDGWHFYIWEAVISQYWWSSSTKRLEVASQASSWYTAATFFTLRTSQWYHRISWRLLCDLSSKLQLITTPFCSLSRMPLIQVKSTKWDLDSSERSTDIRWLSWTI